VWNDHRTITDFQALNAHFVYEPEVSIQIIANVERFKQRAAAVDVESGIVI
jgi:hypothetical protein